MCKACIKASTGLQLRGVLASRSYANGYGQSREQQSACKQQTVPGNHVAKAACSSQQGAVFA